MNSSELTEPENGNSFKSSQLHSFKSESTMPSYTANNQENFTGKQINFQFC